jgi:putative protease
MEPSSTIELVCPAGGLPALKAAVDNGADCVYMGFKDDTNARNFTGLNFDDKSIVEGIRYAHDRGVKVLLALNTYPQTANWSRWTAAVDRAVEFGVDAIILADLGLMDYAHRVHPNLRLHLSVQGSATNYEAINFYRERFGVQRAVLPRVLSLAQVEQVVKNTAVEIEVFGFGGLCVMVEGRCALSAYATGTSPNSNGACSPGKAVRWEQTPQGLETRLSGILIDRFADGERTGYPTICKGRFEVNDEIYYAIEEPASLNTLSLLPDLFKLGVRAIKIEGRQRSRAYVKSVVGAFRKAVDDIMAGREAAFASLLALTEGRRETEGAFPSKRWR